jgi:hypothetical protein
LNLNSSTANFKIAVKDVLSEMLCTLYGLKVIMILKKTFDMVQMPGQIAWDNLTPQPHFPGVRTLLCPTHSAPHLMIALLDACL